MLKIKDDLMRKIYENNLSKFELITIIELIKRADEEGIVNIYYKEMINNIGCNVATFYNSLKKLQDKGFIEYGKNSLCKSEITIGICNNYFRDNYCNYVDINNVLFYTDLYKTLNAGEIRTVMYFILRVKKQKYNSDINSKNHDKNRLPYTIGESYRIISGRLNIKIRMIKIYIKGLIEKNIIGFGNKISTTKNRFDIVTVLKGVLDIPKIIVHEKGRKVVKKVTDKQLHYVNCIKNICRLKKIDIKDNINLNDTAILMLQYCKKAKKNGSNIYKVMLNAFNNLKQNVLESKTVHCIVKELIKKEYSDNVVIF